MNYSEAALCLMDTSPPPDLRSGSPSPRVERGQGQAQRGQGVRSLQAWIGPEEVHNTLYLAGVTRNALLCDRKGLPHPCVT